MTLSELLESDREKLLRELLSAEEPAACEKVLERELERLLYRYNEQHKKEEEREEAAVLLDSAKMMLPLLCAGSSTRIWESAGKEKEKKKQRSTPGMVLLAIGVLCLAGLLLFMLADGTMWREVHGGIYPVFILIGGVALYFSGRISERKKTGVPETIKKVEVLADPDEIYRTLRNMLYFADQDIRERAVVQKSVQADTGNYTGESLEDIDREELDLLLGILEAGESGDGSYALEQAENVRYYLHERGYETVNFSDENRTMFELMPGDQDRTIVPALTKDGRLVRRGRAAHKS